MAAPEELPQVAMTDGTSGFFTSSTIKGDCCDNLLTSG
jgi:hypothetical protein